MASANGDLQLAITANTSGFTAGLSRAQASLGGFRQAAGRARGAGIYFAGALSTIGESSKGASAFVGSLLGGLAIGGPMGLAVGGVNALIGHIQGTQEAAEKAAEASKKWTDGLKKDVDSLNEQIALFNAEMQGGAVGVEEYKAGRARLSAAEKLTAANAELAAATAALAGVEERRRVAAEAGVPGEDNTAALARQAAAQRAVELAKEIRDSTNINNENTVSTARREAALEQQKKATEALITAERELNATFAAQSDLAEKSLDALAKRATDSALAENAARVTALEKAPGHRFAGEIPGMTPGAARQQSADAEWQDKAAAFQADLDTYAAQTQAQADATAEAWVSAGQRIGAALGDAFASGGTAAEKGATVAKAALSEVLSAVLAMAVKQITANAAVTATEAGKSQAGIPIVGPMLAAAAMTAMFASVQGMLTKLPSARGGWDVPEGIDPITQLHGGEKVLDKTRNRKLDDMLDGRGPGGSGITVNVNGAMDADDVVRTLRRARNGVIGELNEWRRDRRMP
jgi:hypothetical protein